MTNMCVNIMNIIENFTTLRKILRHYGQFYDIKDNFTTLWTIL